MQVLHVRVRPKIERFPSGKGQKPKCPGATPARPAVAPDTLRRDSARRGIVLQTFTVARLPDAGRGIH